MLVVSSAPTNSQMFRLIAGKESNRMIVRITKGRIKQGTWAQFEEAWREVYGSLEPVGLRARALIQDSEDADHGASISVWDDSASAAAASQQLQDAMQKLQAFYTGDYELHEGALRAQEGLLGDL
jgi:heme-degrading monooxygenase HmoA